MKARLIISTLILSCCFKAAAGLQTVKATDWPHSAGPDNLQSCGVLTSHSSGRHFSLSAYWAQEMIGADLLKKDLEGAKPLPENRHLISIVDRMDTKAHGLLVENLISGESASSPLPQLTDNQKSRIHVDGWVFGTNHSYLQLLNFTDRPPSFINNSMGHSQDNLAYNSFAALTSHSVLIFAAGNSYERPLQSTITKLSQNTDAVLVGSLSPLGTASLFSQEGEELYILAPSDSIVTSSNANGRPTKFGGTSGAAPLVTASLAGFEWLSGLHPTAKQAKILLKKTAIPTLHSQYENPKRNGEGLLNAYKLGRTALRLKERCQGDQECFSQEINSEDLYNFPTEPGLLDRVDKVFPQCADGSLQKASLHSCTEQKEMFDTLRKAALLNPDGKLWQKLSCVYEANGFLKNAEGLRRLGRLPPKHIDKAFNELTSSLKRFAVGETYFINRIKPVYAGIQWAGNMGEKGASLLSDLLNSIPQERVSQRIDDLDPFLKLTAQNAEKIGGRSGRRILQIILTLDSTNSIAKQSLVNVSGQTGQADEVLKFAEDKDISIKKPLLEATRKMSDEEVENLLESLTEHDASMRSKEAAAYIAGHIGGLIGERILQALFNTDTSQSFFFNYDIRKELIFAAGRIGGKLGEHILLRYVDLVKTWGNQENLADAAGILGGDRGGLVLIALLEKEEPLYNSVQEKIIDSAEKIGGEIEQRIFAIFAEKDPKEYQVIHAAGRIGASNGERVLLNLAESSDPEIQFNLIYATRFVRPSTAESLSKTLIANSEKLSYKNRNFLIDSICSVSKNVRENIFMEVIEHGSPYMKAQLTVETKCLTDMQSQERVLIKLAQDDSAEVRRSTAVVVAQYIGGVLADRILTTLAGDPDSEVQSAVVYGAGYTQNKRVLNTLINNRPEDTDAIQSRYKEAQQIAEKLANRD